VACVLFSALAYWIFRPAGAALTPLPAANQAPEAIGVASAASAHRRAILPEGDAPTAGDLRVPPTWKNQDAAAGFQTITSADPSITQVLQDMIDATFKSVPTRDRADGAVPSRLAVRTVQRVESSELWRRYAHARARLRAKRPHRCTSVQSRGRVLTMEGGRPILAGAEDGVNEVFLWHGTSPGAAAAIAKEGFDVSLAGSSTGAMYGDGVYLSECSSKSDEYAQKDAQGLMPECHCLMLCRVVLGEFLTMGVGGASVHATIAAAMASGQFESVVGDREAAVGTYREFVVYTADQVYPEYIVMYRRE